MDPLSEDFYGISPYNYVTNNPVSQADFDGRDFRIDVIRNDEGVFAGAHEALHLLGSGHKDGIMKDSSTSGGLTAGIYGAILSGVGIGNGSIGTGNKNAIGWGHIRNEKGTRPVGFTGGTIMNRARFDKQVQRAANKRERQERREQRRGN